ncbi:hypothetical protein BaRGS_00001446 [Batillaria attramentaria]|uniref:Uncharacterized protein n=1 Tax=Batillaria attramentaria TaxID=370345 RepID=A0ABD0M839_9CAEN
MLSTLQCFQLYNAFNFTMPLASRCEEWYTEPIGVLEIASRIRRWPILNDCGRVGKAPRGKLTGHPSSSRLSSWGSCDISVFMSASQRSSTVMARGVAVARGRDD